MTPEERTLLTSFLRDLSQACGGPKDAEADAMIAQAMGASPDAAYLLVQHAILSDQALHAAQARIAELESQSRGGPPTGGFLGAGPWAGSPGAQAAPQPQPQPQPQYYQPPSYAPASPFSTGGGLGSFLRSAGTTAAGVVGGEMLFEGLSGLFGGHRGFGVGGGWGGGGFGGGYGAPVENVTINEYNEDEGGYDDNDSSSNWDDSGN